MILPGHLAGGYIAAQLVMAVGHPAFNTPELAALSIVGIIAGELPDIDLIWIYFEHRKPARGMSAAHRMMAEHKRTKDHRAYITHAPLFWLFFSLVIVTLGGMANSAFAEYFGWIILAGTWSHFLLDSIEHGVPWLWPFIGRRFSLRGSPEVKIDARVGSVKHHFKYITEHYFGRFTFYAEILIVVVAVVIGVVRR